MLVSKPPPTYEEAVEVFVVKENEIDGTCSIELTPTPHPSAGPPFPPKPFNNSSSRNDYPVQSASGFSGHSQPTGTYIIPYKTQQQQQSGRGGGFAGSMFKNSDEGFTVGSAFDDDEIRHRFIQKVYFTLTLQLLVTFGIVCIFTFIPEVGENVKKYPGIYYGAYFVFIVLYITLVCCGNVRRQSPLNIILLSVFTLAFSYLVGSIASFYSTRSVVIALGITVVVCFSVSLFAVQTKYDFTKCYGVLFVLSMVLFLFGLVTIFTYHYSWYIHVIYGGLGALVFTLFLAFDTQMIIGGKRHEINPEEYIFGALSLYMDIIYIFIYILSLVGDPSS